MPMNLQALSTMSLDVLFERFPANSFSMFFSAFNVITETGT